MNCGKIVETETTRPGGALTPLALAELDKEFDMNDHTYRLPEEVAQ